jgi:hypothetical protein
MSANCHAASGLADWSDTTLGLAPPRGCGRQTGGGPVATVLLRVRLLLEALKKARHNRPRSEEPEDYPESGSIWDDPALWMLMMH